MPAELFLRYSTRVRAFLLCRTHDPDVADDLTQDVFEAAVRAGSQLSTDGQDGLGWLLTVAQRRFVDELRRQRRAAARDLSLPANNVAGDSRLELQRILGLLNGQQREIFLRRLAGQPFAEIAQATCLSPAVCRMSYSRACARLRRSLAEDERD